MAIFLIGIIFFIPGFALAHGTGESLEKIIDEYKIDIGYSPTILEATSPSRFGFDLLLNDTGDRSEFSDIWVRIIQGKKTVFASGIHKSDFGNTTMIYTFADAGEYELNARFQKEGKKIVEASFPLIVEDVAIESDFNYLLLIVGLLIGAMVSFLISLTVLKK